MNICQEHWDKLREAIKTRGLTSLVSESGEEAMKKMVEELNGEEKTVDNYDPLMSAWSAVIGNGMQAIENCGGDPMWTMIDYTPDQPAPFKKCVICILNWMMDEHDKQCTTEGCQKPPGEAAHFDWMIERAADDQVEAWKALGNG